MPNGNALSPPPPLPFPYLWPPRGTWDSDIKKRILNSPQLIMRWNRSGWYSVSPCLHKEILFIILCYGPGSDSRFTLTPGWDVTVKWTVRGATLTALGIKTRKHHTSIQSFWCWNMHIQSSDSPEESRERQRVQCSRHSLRISESQNPMLWKHYEEKELWEHTARVCLSWGCEKEQQLRTVSSQRHTDKRGWHPAQVNRMNWFAYICCGVAQNSVAANIPYSLWRWLVRRDEGKASYVCRRRGR